MMNPDEGAQVHNSTDEQKVNPNTYATDAEEERTFHCNDCKYDLPISEALYPNSKNPSLCKHCAAKKRQAAKEKAEKDRHTQSLNAIPTSENRGGTKRMTISLSQYATAALEVLAVGRTVSEVAEDAVVHYLAEQDSQVIAFVGRVFSQKQ